MTHAYSIHLTGGIDLNSELCFVMATPSDPIEEVTTVDHELTEVEVNKAHNNCMCIYTSFCC